MIQVDTVTLTDEELEECQQTIQRFSQSEDGEWVVKKESADRLQRGIISHCLMNRAERFLTLAGGSAVHIHFHTPYYSPENSLNEELVERACISAAKACAIYPLSIYFYDFGCILYQTGKIEEARVAFNQFLNSLENDKLEPTMQCWLPPRDMQSSVQFAREMFS